MSDFEVGRIYRVRSRNLTVAVYCGHGKFIGIREKFGDRYLAEEWFPGTVRQAEPMPVRVPADFALRCDLEEWARCGKCGERVDWQSALDAPSGAPTMGGWKHARSTACGGGWPIRAENAVLFELLNVLDGGQG